MIMSDFARVVISRLNGRLVQRRKVFVKVRDLGLSCIPVVIVD
jgi:hypothetical protein